MYLRIDSPGGRSQLINPRAVSTAYYDPQGYSDSFGGSDSFQMRPRLAICFAPGHQVVVLDEAATSAFEALARYAYLPEEFIRQVEDPFGDPE